MAKTAPNGATNRKTKRNGVGQHQGTGPSGRVRNSGGQWILMDLVSARHNQPARPASGGRP